jgi:hypothetical protein
MRLRKPEGVAQLGEESPVLVAARILIRRRGENPMEGRKADEPNMGLESADLIAEQDLRVE